jgi:hypothetical protein
MLKKNKIYSIPQLVKIFGGGAQPSMPFVNGKVPYCKFNPKINPEFPHTAWIEEGPLRRKGAEFLSTCKIKIPVFKKEATNKWIFLGYALISNGTTIKRLSAINKNPPRNKVQIILKFKF